MIAAIPQQLLLETSNIWQTASIDQLLPEYEEVHLIVTAKYTSKNESS